ncbi:IclR family transcriptional regulator [[Clostridium] aminophilum]|uniref:Transcriptional regulator, IclR family n=1 Tax=[Clostridium] aminophilum TaxID=1526 RepID=A0A1I0F4U9_9FIRM|nr:IclR family transcriptional regulator [[Clostridium] aminophilum]MDD6197396.1 IclR family transcriptional regulator [[Clostridium] aminophilum]SET52441.1 transcriptional regulator, IclR family [[Clostridium] aminophilum]
MIQSLKRSMEILELLRDNTHKYTIAEISAKSELPPSTVHRILQTFCEMRYVTRDESSHTYELGPALIPLGRSAAGNYRIQDAALPLLKKLAFTTREDTYLVIRVGDKGLVLQKVDGPNHLKVVEEFGYELDLHCGAIRKVLLAFQPKDYIDYYLEKCVPNPDAFPQISSRALKVELDEIRRDGIACSYGEYVHDACGIGSPVFGPDGKIEASVGIIVPHSRIAEKVQLDRLKKEVASCASELSYFLGNSLPRR